jgi:hypothetical protein
MAKAQIAFGKAIVTTILLKFLHEVKLSRTRI